MPFFSLKGKGKSKEKPTHLRARSGRGLRFPSPRKMRTSGATRAPPRLPHAAWQPADRFSSHRSVRQQARQETSRTQKQQPRQQPLFAGEWEETIHFPKGFKVGALKRGELRGALFSTDTANPFSKVTSELVWPRFAGTMQPETPQTGEDLDFGGGESDRNGGGRHIFSTAEDSG